MPIRRQMVVFKIGREDFALDILRAKEVVMNLEITPLPEATDSVEGVMNLRGTLVPVMDLRKRLRAAGSNYRKEERIIVVEIGGILAGFVVDQASELISVTDSEIEAVPELLTEIGAGYLTGIINRTGRHIAIIDIEEALNGEIRCELNRVVEALATCQSSSQADTI